MFRVEILHVGIKHHNIHLKKIQIFLEPQNLIFEIGKIKKARAKYRRSPVLLGPEQVTNSDWWRLTPRLRVSVTKATLAAIKASLIHG